MTHKPNDVRVSRELLEQLRNVCGDPDLWHQATVALAQPADQQGEPIALSEDVREYLQEGIENATGCEDSDVDYDFAEELALLLGPIYRHAQPATAKVLLPERRDEDPGQSDEDYNSDCGWNACLDKVAKLNGGQS